MKAIPYGHQHITDEDIQAVIETLKSDYLTQGPKIIEFEQAFARYVGAKYAVAVSNATAGLHLAATALQEAGAKRCIPLKVSGPFHSALLNDAGKKLGEALSKVEIHKPQIPYVCNVEAAYVTQEDSIKELLEKQVSHSVRWQQSVEKMIADGTDTFIEIGPGKTLTGFMRKINKDVKVMNVDKLADMEKVLEELGC